MTVVSPFYPQVMFSQEKKRQRKEITLLFILKEILLMVFLRETDAMFIT